MSMRLEGVMYRRGWRKRLVSANVELFALMGGGRCIVVGQKGGASSVTQSLL